MALPTAQPSIHSTTTTARPAQSLARRLLFPNHSGDLPPLLTAPNVPPELQAELYDFIALALRAYVSPWWTKLTRYDKEFLPQIARTLTAVIRALESRVLALDLSALVFHHTPTILTQHYHDYRNAASKLSSSYATGGAASLPQLFHHLQPHIALSADGKIDLEYYRQIVDHILKACLPPEDYAPDVERVIVREVIVKVLVDDVIPKVTQPWFIQKAILDVLASDEEERLFKAPEPPSQPTSTMFSFHTFIVVVLSALQSFSSTCLALIHAYKQAINTIKLVNQSPPHTPRSTSPPPQPPTNDNETEPTQSKPPSTPPTPSTASSLSYYSRSAFPQTPTVLTQHDSLNYASSPLRLFSEIFLTSERLAATSLINLLGMISASMTSFLDKLLPHLLYTTLSPGFILNLVRLSKRTMFPNGYPGPPLIEPTAEEQMALREKLVGWRGSGALSHLAPLLLGADPRNTLGAAIDPLTCQPCNIHLVVILLDRILVGLFPELVGSTGTGTTLATGTTVLNSEHTADSGHDGNAAPRAISVGGTTVGAAGGAGIT
ncbi:hypothetical protein P691DRAFT_654969 [Macrolepiota fuliginosa MF-IS2]|uniref:PXA domain-containing protein n=1 Tax=Macrolepiota fuliginosa MF-IS2 TaxID=1400762 RepID=A0A9P5XQY0_9AGAR|nr:hypothetical protein P691DRAFT_654969 [Macrolepiota fuliginosa MF-IS2]